MSLADVIEAREHAARAGTDAQAALDRLKAAALAALAAGVPLRQVAIAADVSRQTLYSWKEGR